MHYCVYKLASFSGATNHFLLHYKMKSMPSNSIPQNTHLASNLMEIKILSDVCIKPACPTPLHLRHLKLSSLDQLLPFPYAPIVLFYIARNHHKDLTQTLILLKTSLSQILPKFYPLAGRIKDDLTIDCNDDGVRYLEAQVNTELDYFLHQPNLHSINTLLPIDPFFMHDTRVANIQINVFKCNGIAIGVCISHKVLDGTGLSLFLKTWAAATANKTNAPIPPNFNSPSVFPTDTLWLKEATSSMWVAALRSGKFVTKRFVFCSDSVSKLRDETCNSSNRRATRVEAVSAALWRSFINSCRRRRTRPSVLTHLVNLRPRVETSLPITNQTLNNLLWIAPATAPADINIDLGQLAEKINFAISKIDSKFVNKLRGTETDARREFVKESLKVIVDSGSGIGSDLIGFSSWCGFGFYEVDFGWGGPVWIGHQAGESDVFMNVVVLMNTSDGGGIEAWVDMDEEDLDFMAADPALLRYALVDPTP